MLLMQEGKEAPGSTRPGQIFQLLEEPRNTKGFTRAADEAHSIFKNETRTTEKLEEVHQKQTSK